MITPITAGIATLLRLGHNHFCMRRRKEDAELYKETCGKYKLRDIVRYMARARRKFTNTADIVPMVPPNYPKIGLEYTYDFKELDEHQLERFEMAYTYFRGVTYEEDDDPIGLGITKVSDPDFTEGLKNHLASTYMSFILSELPDEEMDLRIGEDEAEGETPSEEAE